MRRTSPGHSRSSEPRRIRSEIQALRAVAVALVVGHHAWPGALPGGFVGVDVFFVVSGFLITSLLLRELERTGRIALAAFWARRARRILPAALMTIAFGLAATLLIVPVDDWSQFLHELRASALYVQNWHLADSAVDYFAADQGPSPVEHFWSLAVEEQFYIVWPVLLGLVALCARTRRTVSIGIVMALLTAASLVYSIDHTASDPASAYFVTPTRAWELGAGGLLALAPVWHSGAAGRALVSWGGLAAIAVAAVTYSSATPFPGVAALLPVLGTLAVIAAGAPAGGLSPARPMALAPVQFLGDISYSVYLWHWPLFVLAPFVVDADALEVRIMIVVLTLLVAWLSKLAIEDPIRAGSFLARRPAPVTLALAGGATVLVVALCASGLARLEGEISKAEAASRTVLAAKPRCLGAASHDPRKPCRNPRLRRTIVPAPVVARRQGNSRCKRVPNETEPPMCEFGVRRSKAKATIALIGDSHAVHWRPALAPIARAKGWRALSITRTGCPFTRAVKRLPGRSRRNCVRWNRQVIAWLKRHRDVRVVFTSNIAGGVGVVPANGKGPRASERDGYAAAWRALPPSIAHVFVIRDTPRVKRDTDNCVQRSVDDHSTAGECAVGRREALAHDLAIDAARRSGNRVRAVDMTRFLCDRTRCPVVIGGMLVYRDRHHLTKTYVNTLSPYLREHVDAALEKRPPR